MTEEEQDETMARFARTTEAPEADPYKVPLEAELLDTAIAVPVHTDTR